MTLKKSLFTLSLAVGLTLFNSSSFAQQAISDSAVDQATSSQSASVSDIQIKSNRGGSVYCPDVSFQDVMNKPNDVDLNHCYALSKVQQGDYKVAASTLERVLMIAPQRHDIRLTYSSVLYRLGAMDESKAQLEQIKALPLSNAQRARIDDYVSQIEDKQRTTRQTVTLGLGMHYDTNRNAAPENDTVLISGNPFVLTGDENLEDEDLGLIGSVGYRVEHDFGRMLEHTALASVSYYHDDQVNRDELDLGALNASVGAKFGLKHFDLTALANYANLQLSKEKFYQSTGGILRLDKVFHRGATRPAVKGWASVGYAFDDYGNISENSTLRERTGHRKDARIGASMWVAPRHRLSLEAAMTNKDARVDFQTYDYYFANLNHIWALNYGQFISTTVSYGEREYDASDAFVTGDSTIKREEEPFTLKSMYSVPVAYLVSKTNWEINGREAYKNMVFDKMNLSVGAEYFNQNSNISNYDYENVKARFLLTKRIEF